MGKEALKRKIWWSWLSLRNNTGELLHDLWDYFVTPYPFLLVRGAFLRIMKRLRYIWFPPPKSRGRPPISQEIVKLILDMKRSNWGWGSLRISNELKMLGIKVSKTTVSKILRENGFIPPRTRFTPISWSTFLSVYKSVWFVDFTTVFDVKGSQIFIFNVIDSFSRKLILSNATLNPTGDWLIQQIRNCEVDGYPLPEALVHDHDGIYGKYFDWILVNEFHVKPLVIEYRKPWQQGKIERFHLSLKTEITNRIPIVDVSHVRKLCFEYQFHYNKRRTHQSLGGNLPEKAVRRQSPTFGSIEKSTEVDGLITVFTRAA